MKKHTPGPWITSEGSAHVLYGGSGTYTAIATPVECEGRFGTHPISREERKANARLIAAAPTMLAALEAAEAELEQHAHVAGVGVVLDDVRMAIAIATGGAE